MKLLVVKTSSMGDVVHAMPALSDIVAQHPGAEIDWVVEAPFAALPQLHPGVRRVIPIAWRKWRKRLWASEVRAAIGEARAALRAERYDCVLDLQGLLKSALWAVQARAPRAARVGYDWASAREPLASLFYGRRARVPRELHAIERMRRLAAAHLGYRFNGDTPRFGLQAPTAEWQPQQHPYAVLITGASRPEKLWPEASWLAIAAQLQAAGLQPVWLWGGAAEGERAQRLAAAGGGEVPPFLTVRAAAALLAGAHVCVGLDTGFSHIAAAFGVATVGIYCDHEPGLVGISGAGFVASLGGRGQVPAVTAVAAEVERALVAAG